MSRSPQGNYDAKKAGKGGFNPGGASLHRSLLPSHLFRDTRSILGCDTCITCDTSGSSLAVHSCMSPHGPEAGVFEAASNVELQPTFLGP